MKLNWFESVVIGLVIGFILKNVGVPDWLIIAVSFIAPTIIEKIHRKVA